MELDMQTAVRCCSGGVCGGSGHAATVQQKVMPLSFIAGWTEWDHIDPWLHQYRLVDGFQEMTLTASDVHLTAARLIFP